ncbi:MAG: NAD(+)/NADH kinase [Nitrospiraceae bacterium]|nr:MAG: NAD(+)/NADH kinase [Nitrospiraceae bacterium]
MKKIGIIVKKGAPEAIDAVKTLLEWFDKKECSFLIEKDAASALKIRGLPREKIPQKSDVIIVFGGDGTLLSVARLVGRRGIPILGVNLGGLGFIAEVGRDEIRKSVIDYIFSKKCKYEERIMLSADVFRGKRRIARNTALNDVVIHKSAIARMIDLDIYINGQYVTTFRADGMIISTPTGSTAHSLSAGGPILYPTLESFVITPICPHTLTNRPIVLPDNFIQDIFIKSGEDVYLTLDVQVGVPVKARDKVKIRKADFKTRFILLHDRDYFQILKKKLKWGK